MEKTKELLRPEAFLDYQVNETELQGRWLRTDELKEALTYLEGLPYFLEKACVDHHYWKWVIISIHSLLHCIMIHALKGSNGLLTYKDEISSAWLAAYYANEKYKIPKNPIDAFLNLYKKVKSGRSRLYITSKEFIATKDHDSSMRRLNSFRNDFIHFSPHSWSIEISGMPRICLDCLDVASFLFWQSGNVFWSDEKNMNNTKLLFYKVNSMLNIAIIEFE
jgi:hypothetical protein